MIRHLFSGLVLALVLPATAMAEDIVVSTVAPTSDDYALTVAWSNLLASENADQHITVVDNGTVKGLRLLAMNRADVAVIGAPHYLDAVNGKGQFAQDPERLRNRYKNMKALFAISTSAGQYVVRDQSEVQSFQDLKGHSLAIGRPGGNAGRVTEAFLSAYGLKPDEDVNTQYITYTEAFDQMANRSLDGTFVWGSLPQAAVDNASRIMKLRFISPTPEAMNQFRTNMTSGDYYSLKTVDGDVIEKAYGGRITAPDKVYFWTFPFMFVVNSDMSDDTAYALTKSLWSNLEQIKSASSSLALIDLKEAVQNLSASLHPGAARYFREIGLIK